jgi:hypothetical protein
MSNHDDWDSEVRQRHLWEQLGGALRDLAPVLFQYQQSLVAVGFSADEATLLVIEAQHAIMEAGAHGE